MRLIDADKLLENKVSNAYISRFEVENAPTIDAEPVVRCEKCKHNIVNGGDCDSTLVTKATDFNRFWLEYCSYGAKMDEEQE